MAQSDDIAKATSFITYLLNSPSMKNENILVAETMIHNFITQNREQLKTTLKGTQYFPHLDSGEAIKLIVSELFLRVKQQALDPVVKFIDTADFGALNKIPDARQFSAEYHKDTIRSFVQTLFKNRDVRVNFSSAYNVFQYNIIDRYLKEIFVRRDFIYNELVRVQKTYLESDDYIIFLKLILLLKYSIYIKVPMSDDDPEHRYALSDIVKMPGKLPQYITMLAREINTLAPNIPLKSVNLAVKSNLIDSMTSLDEGCSRLLYVLCSRFHNYKPISKVDRGAESPDKSWFAIARKNAKVSGFEKNMLDELYRIAGDNNW
jgi:hypothetical protein